MKFTIALSLLALTLTTTALPQGLDLPIIFLCPKPSVGGCCDGFLASGLGFGCSLAYIVDGANKKFVCDNVASDIGIPACCQDIETLPGTLIGTPLSCQRLPGAS
ncbi:hypothetical protein BDZ45DRAFT_671763 [Acephala macrosclerotiorum]|nr:hypothetical protein BDZ45DRAFT_671763 [Acephala macrosclerotiorum]